MISKCFTCQSTPVISSHGVSCHNCQSFFPTLYAWNRHHRNLKLSYYSCITLVSLAIALGVVLLHITKP